jgi:hypothetical protein
LFLTSKIKPDLFLKIIIQKPATLASPLPSDKSDGVCQARVLLITRMLKEAWLLPRVIFRKLPKIKEVLAPITGSLGISLRVGYCPCWKKSGTISAGILLGIRYDEEVDYSECRCLKPSAITQE